MALEEDGGGSCRARVTGGGGVMIGLVGVMRATVRNYGPVTSIVVDLSGGIRA